MPRRSSRASPCRRGSIVLTRFADFLIRFRWAVVFTYIIVTGVLLYHIGELRFEFSFKQFFPDNNPIVQLYNRTIADFGADDTSVLIALEGERLFDRETLLIYKDFHDRIENIDGIVDVDSIINATWPRLENDTLLVDSLFESIPESAAEIERHRDYLLNSELYKGSFISDDGRAVLLVAKLDPKRNDSQARKPILDDLEAENHRLKEKTGMLVTMGGVPTSRSGYAEMMTLETGRLTGISAVLVLLILIVTFRHWAGVAFSLAIVTLATLSPLGIMAITGIPMSLMTTMLPVVVMITGVANSIHFHTRFYEELHNGENRIEAIRETTRHLAVALFITSVTTSIGFSILATTDIRVLAEFGIFVGLGVLSAYLITITLLPAVLAIIPPPSARTLNGYFSGNSRKFLAFVHRATTRHRIASTGVCLVLGVVATYYATTMERKQKIHDDLDDDHPIIRNLHYLESKLGGVLPLDVYIDTGKPDGAKDPEVMRFCDEIKRELRRIPEVQKIYTPSDMIKEMARTLAGGDPAADVVPDDRSAIAQYMMLYGMNEDNPMDLLVSRDKARLRVSSRIDDVFSTEARKIFQRMRTWLRENTPKGITSRLTGMSPVAHMINLYIVNEIFYTFLLAFGIITLLLIVQFRSVSVGLLSLIPNMFPLAVLLGMIGAMDIYLKPSSAITFSIALGIAVDDTVHYITRFLQEYQDTKDAEEAARRSIFGTGKAMVYTTIVLGLGFCVPIFTSDVRANNEFGLLSVGAVLTALLADLFLLPVILPFLFRKSEPPRTM